MHPGSSEPGRWYAAGTPACCKGRQPKHPPNNQLANWGSADQPRWHPAFSGGSSARCPVRRRQPPTLAHCCQEWQQCAIGSPEGCQMAGCWACTQQPTGPNSSGKTSRRAAAALVSKSLTAVACSQQPTRPTSSGSSATASSLPQKGRSLTHAHGPGRGKLQLLLRPPKNGSCQAVNPLNSRQGRPRAALARRPPRCQRMPRTRAPDHRSARLPPQVSPADWPRLLRSRNKAEFRAHASAKIRYAGPRLGRQLHL